MAEIEFLPDAEAEYQEALAWYHERNAAAADRFEQFVDEALRDISQAPERWTRADNRHRMRLVERFPYVIVYRVEADRIRLPGRSGSNSFTGSKRIELWLSRSPIPNAVQGTGSTDNNPETQNTTTY